MLDSELALPVAFVLLATAGLVYAVLALYLYLRFERSGPDKHVPVAVSALVTYYALVFGLPYVRNYVLLPTLVLFLMAMALLTVVWLGSQARSRAGTRMALAGLFTVGAFVCRMGHDIYQSLKRI